MKYTSGVDIEENNGCVTEDDPWFLKMVYSLEGSGH